MNIENKLIMEFSKIDNKIILLQNKYNSLKKHTNKNKFLDDDIKQFRKTLLEPLTDCSNMLIDINEDFKEIRLHMMNILEDTKKTLKNLNIELNDEIFQSPDEAREYLEEIDISNVVIIEAIDTIEKVKEIRVLIHQVLNITLVMKPSVLIRTIKKEISNDKILKDNSFFQDKINLYIEQSHRLRDEISYIKSSSLKDIEINLIPIYEILTHFEIYQDRLAVFEYIDNKYLVELIIKQKLNCNDEILVNKYKLLEIFEVIIYNAAEELCSKEIDLKIIEDKIVNVEIYIENNNIVFRIKDGGRGIPDTKRIFDINFSTKKDRGGSGLGLTEAKRLAGQMNIQIAVNTKEGKGSTFYVLIPIENYKC